MTAPPPTTSVPPTPITARLQEAASRPGGAITFVHHDERIRVSWTQLHEEARVVGATLQQRGIAPGDRVAILSPTTRGLVTAIQATWLAGAASMVLPLPMRMGSLDEFVQGTRARVRHGQASILLIDPQLAAFYEEEPGDPPVALLDDVLPGPKSPGPDRIEIPEPEPDRLVILQYTSGSTSEPKGVMLPDRVLGSNLDAISAAGQIDPDHDVAISWLPLYHDMGLVGLLTLPMTCGADLVQAAPQDFLAHPGSWMQWISDFRGTATAGPNFSWVLATRALKRMQGLDLSSMRIALNGAEPVDPAAVEAFVAEATRHGFRPGAVFPAFGMAELAIGGSFPPPMRGLVFDSVDAETLEQQHLAKPVDGDLPGARRLALLGKPVPGLEMRIADTATGEILPERHVGELEIAGTSVTPGYYRSPEATAELFRDGWLRTGDLAYLVDGELVICGRIKDVVIVGGRNIYPQDIERAVGTVEGVRAGNVIAFGVEGYKGKESVVVVAEVKGGEPETVRKAVHHRVLEAVGVPPRDIMLVKAGTLPKTSSGKLQRSLCKERYLDEELQLV
jgi:fatty-acyl-CoA synthase